MSQHKRPFSCSRSGGGGGGTTTTNSNSSGASGGSALLSPDSSSSMKKAKPLPAATCSLEKEKNGLHHHSHHFDTAAVAAARPGKEEDVMLVDQEELKPGASVPVAMTGVAANLSRKKATPPQPSAKKQLVIKFVKGKPSVPANFEEDTWATLKSAINAIFLKRRDPCDSEKLYQAVDDLCLHKMGGNLYQRVQRECEIHISRALSSLVGQSPDLVVFLSLVEKCWQDFCDQMLTIRGIALVLDRTYVKQTPNVRSLWDMGLQLFRKHLALSSEVEHKVVTGLLRLIEKERQGEAIDRTYLVYCSDLIDQGFTMLMEANRVDDLQRMYTLFQRNRPAELIAKFVDEKLRAGNKGTSEEELESMLDKVLVLFRFIQGKDVFEAFYKKDLAKRLLLGKSASIDAEKSMITKLKTECGSQFTNKLEGMFKDIELSKEINDSFKQSSQARTKLPTGIEMSVHVLTTGYWPTYPPMDVRLPHELNVYQDIFKEFYLSKYHGRRLMWQNSLGHCVLKAEFPRGKKELSVSLFQAVVLMLFNDTQRLSLQDIKDSTGIDDRELRRTLQSLACGKVRVLQKIPKGREIEDEDSFVFNEEFTAPLYRIKVNAIQMKETVEENTSTTERVFQDRQYQVDAAIVRIMKTRKVLSHTLLITELFQQLKFPIKPVDLKKRIESLIDREYLDRDKNNPQIYNYLA
ncbi:hypothetical protein C4D60_Mb07t27280 [Musa balbisiana]|uniref:Cullin family profile domain-containing protein n=1 Tax=Musa balbisiana TaxID=52838 RepID=A0A4S8JJN2_MUSBA|nr:hypothetical protein C4D60_Mb07t27280 [Musa balbisiana]